MKQYNGTTFESIAHINRQLDKIWAPCQQAQYWNGTHWHSIFSPTNIQFNTANMTEWCAGTAYNGKTLTIEKQQEIGVLFYDGAGNAMTINTNNTQWKNPWNNRIQARKNPYDWGDYGQYFLHDFTCNTLFINIDTDLNYGTLENSQYELFIYELDDLGNEIEYSVHRYPEEATQYFNGPVTLSDLKICNKRAKVIIAKTDGALMLHGVQSYNQ